MSQSHTADNGLTEDAVLKLMREHLASGVIQMMTATSWKDGIDIQRPTYPTMEFARAIAALTALDRQAKSSEREFWFTQTWSARTRHDGALEPDCPIGAVCVGPEPEDMDTKARMVRHLSGQFGKLRRDEPFFLIQGKFMLVPAEPQIADQRDAENKS